MMMDFFTILSLVKKNKKDFVKTNKNGRGVFLPLPQLTAYSLWLKDYSFSAFATSSIPSSSIRFLLSIPVSGSQPWAVK
jgi:hypothetical protein